MNRKIRVGMIGGGTGAFIGAIHRIALYMDGQYELVAGAFSSDETKSRETGEQLYIDSSRIYPDYHTMLTKEALLPEKQRLDVVAIVTPNHVHFDPAIQALDKGFHVIIEKPITFSLTQAKELHAKKIKSGREVLLCHTYTGYPMVKQARQLISQGKLGSIRKVQVEYPQGWLSTFLEGSSHKQAAWRTDPFKSGLAGAMGDIGTHAFNLAEYVTGLSVVRVNASVRTVVEGRKLDDDGAAFLEFENGASGVLVATQVASGAENNISIRIYGEKGGLHWCQQDNNSLYVLWPDQPTECWRTGSSYLGSYASHNTRTPAGHPEGYLEAFANLYRNFSFTIRAKHQGETPKSEWIDYPSTLEGIRGMAFIETVIKSSASGQWIDFIK
jgi:predicted dehydrogenase